MYAVGVGQLQVVVEGPEVPILDGSAKPFLTALHQAGGIVTLEEEQPLLEITGTHKWGGDNPSISWELEPSPEPGMLYLEYSLSNGSFIDCPQAHHWNCHWCDRDLGDMRAPEATSILAAQTFGDINDWEKLKTLGFARGASYENTTVFNGKVRLNKTPARCAQEQARHKLLDLLGDLALLGLPVCGKIRVANGGHKIHHEIAKTIQKASHAG
jgi:UDP-3-O-[3-hydroxymyristoyl] N-acetylglucosamine deacetylase